MKALTLHQPWASLVALGVKSVETRSWLTGYLGSLAIHAGKERPPMMDLPPFPRGIAEREATREEPRWFVCDTITAPEHQRPHITDRDHPNRDRVPKWAQSPTLFWPRRGPHAEMVGEHPRSMHLPLGAVVATCQLVAVVPTEALGWHSPDHGWHREGEHPEMTYLANDDQLPFGDFSPGRFAWILDDVKPTEQRCPACWGEGVLHDRPLPRYMLDCTEDCEVEVECLRCHKRKAPRGRSAAPEAANGYCDFECPGYDEEPRRGDLWPGELQRTRERECPACDGSGGCPPIPTRGRQGLWEWTP